MTSPADERRHPAGPETLWGESFAIDFARMDGVGGFVRLGLYPNLGQAWWWTYLVAPGRLVAVRDHDVALPRSGLEVRAEGLWADLICETPLEHWSVGLEAFGVALDEPMDSVRGEWGERLPVGLDLSWEALGPPGPPEEVPEPLGSGYAQPGRVEGDVLVGADRLAFEGWGWRSHRWGVCDWWATTGHWGAVMDGDGTALSLCLPGKAWWRRPPERVPEALPASWPIRLGEEALEATVTALVPVPVAGPGGRMARLDRSLCEVAAPGYRAVGWFSQLV